MGRAPCCDKANVKKGPWSPEEDSKLKEYIEKNGTGGNWISLPQKAGITFFNLTSKSHVSIYKSFSLSLSVHDLIYKLFRSKKMRKKLQIEMA